MKGINKALIGVAGVMAMMSAVSVAHAADATKVLNMEAQSEFIAHIDDYNSSEGAEFIINADNLDSLAVADQVGGADDTWSIWTNASGPVQVKFDAANNGTDGLLSHSNPNVTGPNGEHQIKYRLVYQECGAGNAYTIGGGAAGSVAFGTEFSLPQANANKTVCETTAGNLTITNSAMDYVPFKGTFTAPVTVTVKDPV